MKDILLTGNIFMVTNTLLEKLGDYGKIILCGKIPVAQYNSKKVTTYSYREDDNEFRGIFKSYNLDTVVYFSQVLDGQKRLYDEVEMLENVLYSSVISDVKNLIYVTTNDYADKNITTRTRLLKACEDICQEFAEKSDMNITLLRVPHLFSLEETEAYVSKTIRKLKTDSVIEISGSKNQVTDFLCDDDLGELLARIIDEPQKGYVEANVGGGNSMTMGKFAYMLYKTNETATIKYFEFKEAIPQALDDGKMRELYGWFAINRLEELLPEIIEILHKNTKQETKKKKVSARREKIQNIIIITVEMIFLFFISEFLTDWTAEHYRMDYVDFRLLFVVIMGTIHGIGAGIIASVLACLGYFAQDLMYTNFQIVFFNIENWLPFAAYFLSGTIVGHVSDKNKENIRFLKEQQEILENKYIFLNELYGKTLENKEDYSRQIVGYEDSFGRIYQVVRNLNSTVTDRIFYESVTAMEEILEASSVAIYSIGLNSPFARLNVCSSECSGSLAKTVNLESMPEIWSMLQDNQSWYNAEGKRDYPIYVAPINRQGVLIGMIVLWDVSAEQMKMDYYNRFNIMCGLVQDALVRAIEFNEREESKRMVPGTRFLKAEYFEEIVEMKKQLDKDGMYEYVLMQILTDGMTEGALGEFVAGGIRNTDILGKRADGGHYLLLNQASEESIRIVTKRLEPYGISLKRV